MSILFQNKIKYEPSGNFLFMFMDNMQDFIEEL